MTSHEWCSPGRNHSLSQARRSITKAAPLSSRSCNSCLLPKCLGLRREQLEELSVVWVAVINSCLRDALGPCVLCTSCDPDAKNVSWQSCPLTVSYTKTRTYHCGTCFEGCPEVKHMAVANPRTSNEPSSTGCLSAGALWSAACLIFTLKQYVSIFQGLINLL